MEVWRGLGCEQLLRERLARLFSPYLPTLHAQLVIEFDVGIFVPLHLFPPYGSAYL